jgi:hypothetical protein
MDILNYDNIEKWWKWLVRQRPLVRYGLMAIAGLVAYAYAFHKIPNPWAPDVIPAQPNIATFRDEWPQTDSDTELSIFSDAKFLNRSRVSYEMIKHFGDNDYFLRMHFVLERGPRSLIRDPYCGVYFDWTDPPPVFVDASSFTGLKFRASYSLSAKRVKPKFIIRVAMRGIKNFAFHQYDFSDLLPTPNEFHTVEIPFSLLKPPPWATGSDVARVFDPSEIFRIILTVEGTNGAGESGCLDIDDMVFVPGSCT